MFSSILDEVKERFIQIISENRPDYLYNLIEKQGIAENQDFSEYYGNIGWNNIEPAYKTKIGDYGNADLIQILNNSELSAKNTVLVEIGYSGPVVEMNTLDLIEYWEEILFASIEGFPVVSSDGILIMEFLSTHQIIYSNFKLV